MQIYTDYKFRMIDVTKEQEPSDVFRENVSEGFIAYMPHAVHGWDRLNASTFVWK